MDITNKLFEENQNLVFFTLKTYYPTFINDEDAQQNGMVGLFKACCSFDETKGSFSSYAVQSIRNEIGNELAKDTKRIKLECGVSLDEPLCDGDEDNLSFGDCVGYDEAEYDYVLLCETINKFKSTLNKSEREFLEYKLENPDLSCGELAEHFQTSTNTIHIKNTRLRIKFKNFMEERNDQ